MQWSSPMRKIVSAFSARQGNPGYRVLLILLVSLALVSAVWFAVETYGTTIETPQTEAQPKG
jgi:hypothetical protein